MYSYAIQGLWIMTTHGTTQQCPRHVGPSTAIHVLLLEVTSSKVIVNSGNEAEIRTRHLLKHFLAKLVIMVRVTQVFPTYETTCDMCNVIILHIHETWSLAL